MKSTKENRNSGGVFFSCGMTDKGIKRDHNEDNYYTDNETGIFIVADGIGGHQAGERASGLAVSYLPEHFRKLRQRAEAMSEDQIIQDIKNIISGLNREVYSQSLKKKEYNGMGCTIVTAFADKNCMYIANIGDSRAYLLRENLFKQITIDHSLVGNLVLIGQVSPAQARKHPMKHIITRHIGMEEDQAPDVYRIPFRTGDRLLLTTDGLTDMVSDKVISTCLSKNNVTEIICRELVGLANQNGGEDNITVVLIQKGNFDDEIYKKKPKIRLKYRKIKPVKY